MNTKTEAWTDARVETLVALWKEGLSAREVARRLGVSRNAVIGKIHRLGLSGGRRRAGAARPAGAVRPRGPRRARSAPALRRAGPAPAEADPDLPGQADLLSLSPGDCRWPVGDPRAAGFAFCGRPAAQGPYCPAHAARAVRPCGGARAGACGRRPQA